MEESHTATETPQITFKKRGAKSKPILRKRASTPPPDSDSDSDFTSSEDEQGRQVKRRRKNAGVVASSTNNIPKQQIEEAASESISAISLPDNSNDATKASNWYDERDQKAIAKSTAPSEPDGTYKGVANYQSFIQKNPNAASRQVGPVKASTNVRTITVTDFAPDVCKDYKQTGFCGFGDSCKYLHAREDYKHGWELDRDWEIGTKSKKIVGKTVASANRSSQPGDEEEDDDALLESIPFACVICKKPYRSPIITKCGHYFCEDCALKRYRKDPSCAICGAGTGGVFNVAKKLNKLLDRKRERSKKRRERAIQNGENPSEDEDEEG